jgi:DNA-binding NarL/FixJ family response regulator
MRILIADEHVSKTQFFDSSIRTFFSGTNNIEMVICTNRTQAMTAIDAQLSKFEPFDVAIIDFSATEVDGSSQLNQIDICRLLKNEMPECKLIIHTSSIAKFFIFDIIQEIHPDGFVIKSDVEIFFESVFFQKIIRDKKKYYSSEIVGVCDEMMQDGFFIKKENRNIVQFLALGYKTKQIAAAMHLSSVAINKRLAMIKDKMGVDQHCTILYQAKKKKYV